MMAAVVSSCYGAIDTIATPPPQVVEPDEWVMVHDHSNVAEPWRAVRESRQHWAHPRFAAKHAKCRPFDYTPAAVAIWLDSGARIISDEFVVACLDALGTADVACWPHPQRDTIEAEAVVSSSIAKYEGMAMLKQVSTYGAVPNLYATGCIVWRRCAMTEAIGNAWLAEQLRWGLQDQLSFPYVLNKFGVTPNPLPGGLYNSGLVTWTGH